MSNMKLHLALLGLAIVQGAHGSPIFLQDPPNDNALNIVDFRIADDFSLTQASIITKISFWYQAQQQTDLDMVSYAFYANPGGTLGSMLASGSLPPTTSVDANAFFASFSIPSVTLGAGSYWLELHSGASLTDSSGFAVDWANAADNATTFLAVMSPSPSPPASPLQVGGFEQLAFQLDGAVVPEPPSWTDLAVPMIALCLFSRRKRAL